MKTTAQNRLIRDNSPGNISRILYCCLLLILVSSCSPGEKKATLKLGDPAPEFMVTDIDGKTFSLSDYRGSPVILRFFLTDCKFCRADTPVFNDYFDRFANKGLRILYIDTSGLDNKSLNTFRQDLQIPFPVAPDHDGKVADAYSVKALPQTVVLDPQHKIIAAILGGVSAAELKQLLSPYLPLD